MQFKPFDALQEGTLLKRYKRFLADIRLDNGEEIVAHCPNSGSMLGMKEPGSRVLVRHVPDPKRKLKWTWEFVHPPGEVWVGCNTHRPNEVVEWAIQSGQIPGLSGEQGLRREVKYGENSRIDLLLGDEATGLTYVEVKNTTLRVGEQARFPDAVTTRGAKHMRELAAMVDEGHRAVVVFLVNRSDCDSFDVARDIDSAYGEAFDAAIAAGVEAIPLGTSCGPDGWRIRGVLPLASGD
ncbi:MAG: DNA/RNA nuclease SfsA [Thermoplasmatota archaeon]